MTSWTREQKGQGERWEGAEKEHRWEKMTLIQMRDGKELKYSIDTKERMEVKPS